MEQLMQRIEAGEIPAMTEFESLKFGQAQVLLVDLRKRHKNPDIVKAWGVPGKTVNNFFLDKYKIAKTRTGEVLLNKAAIQYMESLKRTSKTDANQPQPIEVVDSGDNWMLSISRNIKPSDLGKLLEVLSGPEQGLVVEIRVKQARQ